MENKLKVFLFAFVLGCVNNTQQKADTNTKQELCELFAPTGTYSIQFNTVDSTCGRMGDVQSQVVQGIVIPDEAARCRLAQVDWDDSPCITHSVFYCDDGLWDMTLDWRIQPDSESSFSGTLGTTMLRFTGWNCVGQYDLSAVKVYEEE